MFGGCGRAGSKPGFQISQNQFMLRIHPGYTCRETTIVSATTSSSESKETYNFWEDLNGIWLNMGRSPSSSGTAGGKRSDSSGAIVRKNVKSIAEKLKHVPHEELMHLKSIQSILSALRHEDLIISEPEEQSDNGLSNESSSTSHDKPSTNQEGSSSGSENAAASESESVPMMCHESDPWSLLWRMPQKLWKTVQKCLLLPKKPSKSNAFGLFFLILACIFYFELHTSSGFTRLWLKWENVDLGSVEVNHNNTNYFLLPRAIPACKHKHIVWPKSNSIELTVIVSMLRSSNIYLLRLCLLSPSASVRLQCVCNCFPRHCSSSNRMVYR